MLWKRAPISFQPMGTLNTLTGLFGSGWREVEFENSDDIPDKEDDMKKKHLQPLTPAALYARGN